MLFLPPAHLRDQCTVTPIEEKYHHLLMPHSKGHQTTGSFGAIVTQVAEGVGYSVWDHYFDIKECTKLYAYTDVPILSINYSLEGTPVANLLKIGLIPLTEGTYQLVYVPNIEQEVWLRPRKYRCVHVVYDLNDFKKMEDRHVGLKKMASFAFEQSQEILLHESGKMTGKIKAILKEITEPKTDQGETDLNRHRRCLELLLIYMRKHHGVDFDQPLADRSDEEKLVEIGKFIELNYALPLNIDILARMMGKCNSEFHRLFKEHFGKTPYIFLLSKRLNVSRELILTTDDLIGTIALLVGFNDLTYFSKKFKEFHGELPSAIVRGQHHPSSS